jgi:CBS domain containing-hemolysin-like protein
MIAQLLLLSLFCVFLGASAYCSSAETAFFAVDPLQLRHLGDTHAGALPRIRLLLSNPQRLLSTVLIGNTIVNILISNIGYLLATRWFPRWGGTIAVPAVTVLLLVFGEMGPKRVAVKHPLFLIRAYAPSLLFLTWAFTPLRALLDFLSRRFSRHFRPRGKTLSEEEFETVLDISREEGVLNADELAMIKAIVNLEDLHASDVMTPRVDFVGIDLDDEDCDALDLARRSRHNFLPLYRSRYDLTEGFLDVRRFLLDPAHDLDAARLPLVHVPEGIPLNRLLTRFQKEKLRIALVADEYGGIAGLVTRGDILEEITGDIYAELAKPRPIFQDAGPHAWLVDASISLEEINRKLLLSLEAESSDRLAGWITEKLGAVPRAGDVVESPADGIRVRVMQTVKLRVTLATIQMLSPATARAPAEEVPRA